jgi:hypothetical protein
MNSVKGFASDTLFHCSSEANSEANFVRLLSAKVRDLTAALPYWPTLRKRYPSWMDVMAIQFSRASTGQVSGVRRNGSCLLHGSFTTLLIPGRH